MNEIILKNPISNRIRSSIDLNGSKLNIAVPFLSSFALTILNHKNTLDKIDKRLVTRFDDSSISSFDIPTLKTLLDFGFDIRYDNSIHLKLYITDNETFITSSNFTKGGFENNVELTVKVDLENTNECIIIFNEIWGNCKNNKITYDLLNNNLAKYEVLRKKEKFAKIKNKSILMSQIAIGEIDIEQVINEIFNQNQNFSGTKSSIFKANKLREKNKERLKEGFDNEIFYVPNGHKKRRENLFYDFVYGVEASLAGTGLREKQFKTAFTHSEFQKVIEYMFPEMIGLEPWNFEDKNVLLEFCNGIFDFRIPQYTEALPIRLASYFYPNYFIQIFKLDHLKKVCDALGLETNVKSNGDKLFVYNSFINEKMKALPFENYIKSNISYQILYTIELYTRLNKGESFENVLASHKQIWKKGLIKNGKTLLIKLNVIKNITH
jgi:hypothetical protein